MGFAFAISLVVRTQKPGTSHAAAAAAAVAAAAVVTPFCFPSCLPVEYTTLYTAVIC